MARIPRNCLLFLLPLLSLPIWLQAQDAPALLEPGQVVARELSAGASQAYRIPLRKGQFLRVLVEQVRGNQSLALFGPEGGALLDRDLSPAASTREPLSYEAAADGEHRLVVRGDGAYRLRVDVKLTADEGDRRRIEAERLLGEKGPERVERLQDALRLWQRLQDRYWEAETLRAIGSAYEGLDQARQAIPFYEQARAIHQDGGNRREETTCLNGLAWAHFRLSQYEKAGAYAERGLAIAQEHQLSEGKALALYWIGRSRYSLAREQEGIAALEQAVESWLKNGNKEAAAFASRFLGDIHTERVRFDKAIQAYERARALSREIGDRWSEALALGPLANVYNGLGQPEKSIEYFEQALVINREVKNFARESNNLIGLGNGYMALGKYEKAIEYYEQSLAKFREHKLPFGEAMALSNLGCAHMAAGRNEKAIEYIHQAQAIYREQPPLPAWSIYPLIILGGAYRGLGRYEEATAQDELALALARQTRKRGREAEALQSLMMDWQRRGRMVLAIFFGKGAVNLYQEIRSDLVSLDREAQQSYAKANDYAYRHLADLLIAQGRLPEAEQVIGLLKEEEYFDFIRRDSANAPQAGKVQLTPEEAAIEKRYREIADRIADLGVERGALIGKSQRTAEEEQRLARIDADLVVAGNAFQQFLARLETTLGPSPEASGKAYALRESQGLMQDLRELGAGTVALHTLITDEKYLVILTTPDFQKGYETPIKAAELNRKVLAFREALQHPRQDPLPLAQELYRILLAPVAKDLEKARATTLMWSLDGVLRYLPAAALHDGKQYLVERYRNVVFTPASQSRLLLPPAPRWDVLGLGVSKAHGERIPALPGVLDEMRGIVRQEGAGNATGVLPGVVKLDEQFTQDAMLAELRRQHKVVHIASHFQFQPGNETQSALLLGDGSFLSLAQIKAMPNIFGGVDLLTLSACNTATGGSAANGKEVEGFGVLAQRQGAKAVIASLWPVADRSTTSLMQEFYRLRETGGDLTKAEAMRQAQLKLLRGQLRVAGDAPANREIVHEERQDPNQPRFRPDPNAPYAHPYYWAPFILIGNWK